MSKIHFKNYEVRVRVPIDSAGSVDLLCPYCDTWHERLAIPKAGGVLTCPVTRHELVVCEPL